MYSIQRLYFHDHSLLDTMQRVGNIVVNFFKALENGLAAAKVAQINPTDREKLLAILSEE